MDAQKLYDVVIVGGGPAGLTAALYLARARYRVIVIEKERFGGQITITEEVVNYPGVESTSGAALTDTMRKQAKYFGAEFLLADVEGLELNGDIKYVMTSRGMYSCFGILIATGAHPRKLGFPGEERFRGRGVAYCATCDGEFFTNKQIFVVGGGFAAAEESVFLTKYASHVTIMIRKGDFSCAKSVADAARNHEKITIMPYTVIEDVSGDKALNRIVVRNVQTNELSEFIAPEGENFGVFIFAGYEPATKLVEDFVDLDQQGYIITNSQQETSVPGLYAAGDVCQKNLRQVVTAVGEAAQAATELERWAAKMSDKTGITPMRPGSNIAIKDNNQSDNNDQTKSSFNKKGNKTYTYLDASMKEQLDSVFSRMENPIALKLYLDDRPVSQELKGYMEELASWTDKLSVIVSDEQEAKEIDHKPCVYVMDQNKQWSGLAFHGVPGGHEFTSFILGLYNVSGPGQPIDEKILEQIKNIDKPIHLQALVSLSCTMCPDLVVAIQRIASENSNIISEVYDINHFVDLKEHYDVMSVPCLVIDKTEVMFGKKSIEQILDILIGKM